jgi:ATP-binding cassette subfamily F protein 3
VILSVGNVSKNFGVDIILENVTFRIEEREKVALVGRNGAGKTTLLRIITGAYKPDNGSVIVRNGATIAYLKQEIPVDQGLTVRQEAEQALERQIKIQARLEVLQPKLDAGLATSDELDEYSLLHEHLDEAEGYSVEHDLKTVLNRMGFEDADFDKLTSELSGGQRTRLALARLLLEEPDLLILDEPTNHLDLQATEWLEGWIRGYHGAVLLVSHDRTFLQNTAERVLELRDLTVRAYPGPFEKYIQLRLEEDARMAEVAKRQEQEIAKMDEFVRRFMNSQRTAQARGRQKLMNRMIENRVEAPKSDRQMKGGFGTASRSGDIVVETQRLGIGYPGKDLKTSIDWTVRIGERWGVVGENGAGKSTLIKTVMGRLDALGGTAKLGSNVIAGFFDQDTSDLDPDDSPLDALIWDLDLKPAEARDLLARFLITGDDVYRPIRTMSGGEKNKLMLARLTHLNPNLLVLDEPTNHLDMASREALGQVIKEFKGTLIVVSHDRWLLRLVADHILDVRKEGAVKYEGTYDEYRRWATSGRINADQILEDKPKPAKAAARPAPVAVVPAGPVMTPRELSKEIQRLQKLVVDTESLIADCEENLRDIESELANLSPDADVFALTREHAEAQGHLAEAMKVWEETSVRVESLIAQRDGVPA